MAGHAAATCLLTPPSPGAISPEILMLSASAWVEILRRQYWSGKDYRRRHGRKTARVRVCTGRVSSPTRADQRCETSSLPRVGHLNLG